MVDPTHEVLAGNIGFFWPQTTRAASLDTTLMERGYIRRTEDNLIEVRALDESEDVSVLLGAPAAAPTALLGAAERTGLLIPEIIGVGRNSQFGGSRASIRRYRARSVITGVDLSTVRSSNLTSASLTFADGLGFAGLSSLTESFETDPATHLLRKAAFTLESQAALNGGRHGAFEIALEPDWTTSGTGATRNLNTGLAITLTVTRPRPFGDFRPLLIGIQDLLNCAYDRYVVAQSGRAVVDGAEPDADRSNLWLADTMNEPPHTVSVTKRDNAPLFYLEDLGGSAGLRRWLTLRNTYPDAAYVISSGHRYGGARQPSRLLEVATAIEIYVNSQRKAGPAWAKKSKRAPTQFEALARRVGKPFEALVGDPHTWAERFRTTYNGIKHDPSFARDAEELRVLSWSAQVLLLAALLDRAGNTKAPSRRLLSDYRLESAGSRLRSILGT